MPDQAVTRAASALASLAARGDRLGAERVMERLTGRQLKALAFTLAASADRAPVRLARSDRDAHAAYNRYRRRGVERGEMPAWVSAGERRYMRDAKRAHLARRAEREEGEAA